MTRQEFESRYGKEVSAEEYKSIENIYMCVSMDKDAFCAMYKSIKSDEVAKTMQELAHSCDNLLCKLHIMEGANLKAKIEMGHFLADEAQEYSSAKAREKAIEILGAREYIAYRFQKGWSLWKEDESLIIRSMRD